MATKKKAAKKGPSKKKAAVTKAAATATLSGNNLKMNFPLDATRVAAIKRCIAKGKLTVTVNKVNLGGGRLGESWIYD